MNATKRRVVDSGVRPKSLGLHGSNLPSRRGLATTPESDLERNDPSRCDSANFEAARRLLNARLESGLTQEEFGYLTGESPRQVQRRERGEVKLGPLRALVVLERAGALKAKR